MDFHTSQPARLGADSVRVRIRTIEPNERSSFPLTKFVLRLSSLVWSATLRACASARPASFATEGVKFPPLRTSAKGRNASVASNVAYGGIADLRDARWPRAFLQRRNLGGERPREFVEGPFGRILLRNIINMGEAARKRHRSHMYRRHLRSEHRFDLIARLDPFDDCKHEVRPFF